MLDQILPWLLAGFLIVFAAGALRRIAMWRAGRPQKVDLIAGLLPMPRRYLVDLHHVVDRGPRRDSTSTTDLSCTPTCKYYANPPHPNRIPLAKLHLHH